MDRPPLIVTAFNAKVFAVDRATGDIAWRFLLVRGDIVELAIDDQVVIACTTGALVFLDYATGSEIKYIRREDIAAGGARPTMLVDDHHVYITGSGTLACYSTRGDLRWEQKFSGEGYGHAAIGVPGKVRQADDPGKR